MDLDRNYLHIAQEIIEKLCKLEKYINDTNSNKGFRDSKIINENTSRLKRYRRLPFKTLYDLEGHCVFLTLYDLEGRIRMNLS